MQSQFYYKCYSFHTISLTKKLKIQAKNKQEIDKESARLVALGYEGNIKEKMYKSARYYFRKKSEEKKEPAKSREYKAIDREIIDSMDIHIQRNITTDDYSPANGFDKFLI